MLESDFAKPEKLVGVNSDLRVSGEIFEEGNFGLWIYLSNQERSNDAEISFWDYFTTHCWLSTIAATG